MSTLVRALVARITLPLSLYSKAHITLILAIDLVDPVISSSFVIDAVLIGRNERLSHSVME
jgi:hypothetical protein